MSDESFEIFSDLAESLREEQQVLLQTKKSTWNKINFILI